MIYIICGAVGIGITVARAMFMTVPPEQAMDAFVWGTISLSIAIPLLILGIFEKVEKLIKSTRT